jgi:hypothetical protein
MAEARPELTLKDVAERRERKVRRITGIQMSPVSSLPMTLIMLWMAGNDIQMFSIMITGNAIYQPIAMLAQTGAQFASFDGDADVKDDLIKGKLIYAAMCVVALLVGLAKLHFMGLLPTAAADWLDHAPPQYVSIARPLV